MKEIQLSEVSRTALITLSSRAAEYRRKNPIIEDPEGKKLLDLIHSLNTGLNADLKIEKLPISLTKYLALRARKYDSYLLDFVERNRDGLVINLGCGFDTRFWRCSMDRLNYIEVDLPEVIEVKRSLLGKKLVYETIGLSVLDEKLWEVLRSRASGKVLFIAEGLLMYLPPARVHEIFKFISSFGGSEFIFEVVNKKYTKGLWKRMVESKMKRSVGSDAGSSYQFGIENKEEIESLNPNFKVLEEWSYFEDTDIRPKIMRNFRNIKAFSRTQWTIRMAILSQKHGR